MTGSGRIFSAGVDLLRLLDGGAPYIRKFLPALSTMFATVFSHPKPVVAAINGHAIAGGCVLACAADRRLMARDGRPHRGDRAARRRSVPADRHGDHAACATAPQYFEEAIFSGATYAPLEAVGRGFVHDIVEPARAHRARRGRGQNPGGALARRLRLDQAADARSRRWSGWSARTVDAAAVAQIWTAPETLARIRDYVSADAAQVLSRAILLDCVTRIM